MKRFAVKAAAAAAARSARTGKPADRSVGCFVHVEQKRPGMDPRINEIMPFRIIRSRRAAAAATARIACPSQRFAGACCGGAYLLSFDEDSLDA